MKKGDTVNIYEDWFTGKKLEGKARLVKKISEDINREYWEVRFLCEEQTYFRFIKKEAS